VKVLGVGVVVVLCTFVRLFEYGAVGGAGEGVVLDVG